MNAATPIVMTMAVRFSACASGSAVTVSPSLVRPRTGGLPDGPQGSTAAWARATPITAVKQSATTTASGSCHKPLRRGTINSDADI